MGKQNSERPGDLSGLVRQYDEMMEDPKAYANGTYKRNIASQGRRWGGTRDAIYKTQKPGQWDKGINGLPV